MPPTTEDLQNTVTLYSSDINNKYCKRILEDFALKCDINPTASCRAIVGALQQGVDSGFYKWEINFDECKNQQGSCCGDACQNCGCGGAFCFALGCEESAENCVAESDCRGFRVLPS